MEIQEIKAYMKSNKITYEELANRSGLSISTIKKIFSGISKYPRVDTMQIIEKSLGLDKEKSLPSELTKGEQDWLKLYYELNEDDQATLINVVQAFKDMSDEQRLFMMQAIRLATKQ